MVFLSLPPLIGARGRLSRRGLYMILEKWRLLLESGLKMFFRVKTAAAKFEECDKECRPACISSSVRYSISTAGFPTTKQLPIIERLMSFMQPQKNITQEYIARNYILLSVYFSTLQIQVRTYVVKKFSSAGNRCLVTA